ncbi:MAG TPA: vanadium-dependent haloperoxidase [Vicinamibacterales bacterium]|nr:vanadium-dependent haloperoxidase [Vicinamibacterales bacterium]
MNRITLTLFVVLSLSVLPARPAVANAVIQWNANAGNAALAACISPANDPLHESRLYAMMHIAIHDALNAIDRRSRPYAFDTESTLPVSHDAAVAAAARDVLVPVISAIPFPAACLDAGIASVETDYAAALAAIPPGDARTNGIALGQAAAAAIVALRMEDGSDTPLLDFSYQEGTAPGEYRFTPGFDFAFAPGWANVTPFVLHRSSQFRASPPYRVRSAKYAQEFDEVKALGGDGITTPTIRTPEQTVIGLFWLESSPLQWNRIARAVAESRGLGVWESARLFGLLNLALADGYIASWDTKYHYRFWRPVTAIQTADSDGNPATSADPAWTPLQLTYPMPDHDSAHSVQGSAAAEVMARVFGSDDIAFDACSLSLPAGSQCADATPVWRSYSSFSQAAEENAVSRIYVGIHFRRASEEGLQHGRKIGNRAVNLFMRPTR